MFPRHGQCAVWLKFLRSSTVARHFVGKRSRRPTRRLRCAAAVTAGVVVSAPEVGRVSVGVVCFARSLRCSVCLPGLLLCACFRLSLPLLGFFILLQLAPCFGSCSASRGHHFALGTGGFKQSLLVGGIGPVYSLPKYGFKPSRRLSAVGFVLGWHREPLFNNNPAGTVGFCRRHGGNH